jgi:uncharacterized protein YggU (UPF0235/DUF167 family)
MGERNFHLHDGKKGSALAVRVIPGSSMEKIVEVMQDGTLKICLTNKPKDPGINRALVDFLSRALRIPANGIDVVAGENGMDKLVSVLNLDAETVHQRITRLLK